MVQIQLVREERWLVNQLYGGKAMGTLSFQSQSYTDVCRWVGGWGLSIWVDGRKTPSPGAPDCVAMLSEDWGGDNKS